MKYRAKKGVKYRAKKERDEKKKEEEERKKHSMKLNTQEDLQGIN